MPGKVIQLGILLNLLDKVTGPAGKISRAFSNVEKSARMADKAVNFARRNWATGWRVGLAGMAMATPFILGTKAIIDTNAQLEKFETQLITAKGGSAALGRELLEWAKEFSALTPFEIPQVVEATSMLEIYGISAKKWFPLIGNMAGSMGKDVVSAAYGIAKALTGGGFDVLRESFGITGQILRPFGFKGKMKTPEDIANLSMALQSFIQSKFAGGMERMAKTWQGAMSMISDAIFQIKAKAGAAIFDKLKVDLTGLVELIQSPAFQESAARWGKLFGDAMYKVYVLLKTLATPLIAIINFVDRLTKSHPGIVKFAIAFGLVASMLVAVSGAILMFVSGLGWIAAGIFKAVVILNHLKFAFFAIKYAAVIMGGSIVSAITKTSATIWTFMATNPVGWILLAISAIVLFAIAWKKNWYGIGDFMNKIIGGIVSGFTWLWNHIMAVVKFIVSLPGKFWEAGKNLVLYLWEGIKHYAMLPVNAVMDISKKIRNLWPFSPAKEGPLRDIDKAGLGFANQIAYGIEMGTGKIKRAAAAAGMTAAIALSTGMSTASDVTAVAPMTFPSESLASKAQRLREEFYPGKIPWWRKLANVLFPPGSHITRSSYAATIGGIPGAEETGINETKTKVDKISDQISGNIGAEGGMGISGMVIYNTYHFERDSINITAGNIDAESFRKMLGKVIKEELGE